MVMDLAVPSASPWSSDVRCVLSSRLIEPSVTVTESYSKEIPLTLSLQNRVMRDIRR